MRLPIAVLALALPLGLLTQTRPSASPFAPTTRSFSGITSWSEYVTMRDGVKLAADIHVPKGLAPGERTATILHLSRYYRSVDIRGVWTPFFGGLYPLTERDVREAIVKAGYSWVDVDVRGSGASFGVRDFRDPFQEERDGSDILDWIVAQPWAAGAIAATGSSYDGVLTSLLAGTRHPALKAIVPRFSGWDVYGDIFVPGGLQASALIREWSKIVTALDSGRLSDILGWTATMVSSGIMPVDPRQLPAAMAEHAKNEDLGQLVGTLTFRDDLDPRGGTLTLDDFSPHTLTHGGAAVNVPVYDYAGWFDAALPRGEVRQYLSNRNAGSRLRLGPWFHGGDFNASPDARARKNTFDHAREMIRFLDYHLRGIDQGFTSDAPVQYYTMGEERWKSSPTWPPPGAVWQSLYFAAGHSLEAGMPAVESAHDDYRVDPAATSGAASRWGFMTGTGIQRGYKDRRDADRRLLTYTTPLLTQDIEVTGHPVVRLFLKANATDGGVFGYLEDVAPNGVVRYVTEGELRLLHRKVGTSPIPGDPALFHSFTRADGQPMVSGELSDVEFDLLPTSFLFRAGHAIRVAIAGADADAFDVPAATSPLVYDVYRDRPHPSRIDLPTYPVH